MNPGSAQDPLWYKDAVIYELHVRAFYDGNNDGIGDFKGLMEKLDYLQDLGVTCLWLLPFFPSPLRDDGYDIADYENLNPSYGSLEDFRKFLAAAHERSLQVIIELVVNHTSDAHPWFQAARQAPPGSPEREFYVWSDSDKKYSDARIIFTDTEKSNWTWDPVAGAYYWHRFFSHQPDLNYDNPAVLERVIESMRFWMDMGVDGLRLDAIPYLVEREGTNCENLPETHVVIKKIREALDVYDNRLLLAEANQWPTDVRPYFGDGDECHMAFHFPVMPRIFMALRMEDRHPITDIMAQTPEIPPNCQWGLFLRNHDELTLEMVTADERDYMYLAYSADPKMKINVGIRRRLAPLMENNPRRIELLSSLLFSFPGTPIMYYGDEIGMGDNIYLGDRNGVRTPMQWSPDRNAGFSRADPARLYSPVIMDPVYGYQAINVEAQVSDSSSLLHWMRNMIALRKLFKVFGRGTIQFLQPQNRKVLAYLRQYNEDQILCVANLSRFAQAVELDLSAFAGMKPIEMFGYSEFPVLSADPYRLSLNPYGFYWFELQKSGETADIRTSTTGEIAPLDAASWRELFESEAGEALEMQVLPAYLESQRWFVEKDRQIETVRITDWGQLIGKDQLSALVMLHIRFTDGSAESYFLPLSKAGTPRAEAIEEKAPDLILYRLKLPSGPGILFDSLADDEACALLVETIGFGGEVITRKGAVRAWTTPLFRQALEPSLDQLKVSRIPDIESPNTVCFGGHLRLKTLRRLEPGLNIDVEVRRYLTEHTEFDRFPRIAGALEYVPADLPGRTIAIFDTIVDSEGEEWTWTQEELGRYYDQPARDSSNKNRPEAAGDGSQEHAAAPDLGISLDAAATLGRRTGELHLALSTGSRDESFAPEAASVDYLQGTAERVLRRAGGSLDLLQQNLGLLEDDALHQAKELLARRDAIRTKIEAIGHLKDAGRILRIHGDYHLGKVLRYRNDYFITGLNGDITLPLKDRRAKQSPLKDIASMLRSVSYAAYTALASHRSRRAGEFQHLLGAARLWETRYAETFVEAYRETVGGAGLVPADPMDFQDLLNVFLLDRGFFELEHELKHRLPSARIPLQGLVDALVDRFPSS